MDFLTSLLFIILQINFFITIAKGLTAERLVGAQVAAEGQFSYQVSIHVFGEFLCGGAIIDKFFVSSAAHCAFYPWTGQPVDSGLTVVAGSLNSKNLTNSVSVHAVVELYVLKSYLPAYYRQDGHEGKGHSHSDLVILKVTPGFVLSPESNLRKLKIPEEGFPKLYKRPVVTGQGFNSMLITRDPDTRKLIRNGSGAGILRSIEAEIVSRDACMDGYKRIVDSDFCARVIQQNGPTGTCAFDSGSPLVYNDELLIGILSGGPMGCNESEKPSIYGNASYHSSFIQKSMKGIVTSDMFRMVY